MRCSCATWEETALLRSTWLVATREYREHLGTKAFWIGILLMPVILLISTFGPVWLESRATVRRYAVLDRSGWLLAAIDKRALATDLARILRAGRVSATSPEGLANLPSILREPIKSLSKLGALANDSDGESKLIRFLTLKAAGVGDPASGRLPEPFQPEDVETLLQDIGTMAAWWSALRDSEAAAISPESSRARFCRVSPETDDTQQLNQQIENGDLFAYFVLPEDPVDGPASSKYVSDNVTDRGLLDWFRTLAGDEIRVRRLEREGISPQVGEWIQQPIRLEVRKTNGNGGDRTVGDQDLVSQWLPMVISLVLWFAVFGVSQMLLTNTIEEKSNRVLEILLSSISALQLLTGKIVGIALTGLTVLASWLASFMLVAYLLSNPASQPARSEPASIVGAPLYLTSFLFYFILGYLFYAALLVGIGSICNSLKEAQNLMIPVSMLLFMPLLTLLPVSKDPNGDLAMVLSFIPPFTPFVMMNRAAGPPALWEYVLSSIILIVSIVILFWGAAKVFRIGILMTSQRPSLRSILGWLRAPVGPVAQQKAAKPRPRSD